MRKNLFLALSACFVLMLFGCQNAPGNSQPGASGSKAGGVDDICNYFSKELVEEAIGAPIVKVEGPAFSDMKSCNYYTLWDEKFYGGRMAGGPNISVVVEEGLAAWKADKEKNGYKLEQDSSISMDHYAVRDNAKKIWQVTLILGSDKYLRIQANHSAVDGQTLVKIGARFAQKIQAGK